LGSSDEDLIRFIVVGDIIRHTCALFLKTVSGCYESRGSVNVTRMGHSVDVNAFIPYLVYDSNGGSA
jgi:hypothetical protein